MKYGQEMETGELGKQAEIAGGTNMRELRVTNYMGRKAKPEKWKPCQRCNKEYLAKGGSKYCLDCRVELMDKGKDKYKDNKKRKPTK